MTTLMQASHQWASRPEDERFVSLPDMHAHLARIREESRSTVVSSRTLEVFPDEHDHKGLTIAGPDGRGFAPTHWSFAQLAQLAEAPAGYLRTLPAEIAADALNFGLRFRRGPEDVGILTRSNGTDVLRAATGPAYGRIWNADIVRTLMDFVGDGITGDWRVPGEFGNDIVVTKKNTTLYASDRDCFMFLADERNRIEIPNRRDGRSGSLARGFFIWNSETGKCRFGLATFLFDYVCCNRIVWGAESFKEIGIRHTASAPDKWLEEVRPALITYADSRTESVVDTVRAAQAKKVDDLDKFLASRFTRRQAAAIKQVHQDEEQRPIETLWDVTTAVTAYARQIPYQDERIELERVGGGVLKLAA